MQTTLKVGQIGLGAFGRRIAIRLLDANFALTIYDLSDVTLRMFSNEVGGMITGSPKMMAQVCDVVIAVLPSAAEVRDAAFGWEGAAGGFKPGGVLLDVGTSEAEATAALARELAARGIALVDAPAIGTTEEARAGRLKFLVGGEDAAIERCRPVFAALGETVVKAGPPGSGQAANALVGYLRAAALLAGCEAAMTATRAGLDPGRLLEAAEALGAMAPAVKTTLAARALTRSFDSGLGLGFVLKDVEAALALARASGAATPLLAACRDALAQAERDIGSGADQTALIRWLERLVPPKAGRA